MAIVLIFLLTTLAAVGVTWLNWQNHRQICDLQERIAKNAQVDNMGQKQQGKKGPGSD